MSSYIKSHSSNVASQYKYRIKHILVRFSDHLRPENEGTIIEHEKVIKKTGYVWFGKIGKTIKKTYPDYVKSQNAKGRDVFVIFLKQARNELEVYRAPIIEITRVDIRQTDENRHIPEYYRNAEFTVGFWVKIDSIEKLSPSFVDNIYVSSSKSPLVDSLSSTAGVMFVEFRNIE